MVDKVEITLTDLGKKPPDNPAYKGFYSLKKRTYQSDREIVTESIALGRGSKCFEERLIQ